MEKLEKMTDFFTARVDDYDEHMLSAVEGCKEGYAIMANAIPKHSNTLLDLGCGSGLELEEIFKVLPYAHVTGIDLTMAMLEKLSAKFPEKQLKLICGDYFTTDFGKNCFDCAVSFESLHHFKPEKKSELYKKIYEALTETGCYIECDYMVDTQAEEDFYFAENDRLRKEANIPDDELCHYDTPCTIDNQINMLKKSGFTNVEQLFRLGGTVMLSAKKGE